jgi:plastocyanin domain-containing protein
VIQVTDKGFEPETTVVRRGEPIHLLVTRRSDHTCATEMVFADLDTTIDLPHQEAVSITLAPGRDTLRYACAMDMYTGVIVAK